VSRRRFARSRPDMGWIVGKGGYSFQTDDGNPVTILDFLFDFADIDPEAVTGKIEADKSDWFIKRVILDLYAVAVLDGFDENDSKRFFSIGLSTCGIANGVTITDNDLSVFSPEWYNLQARILQTDVCVAYHTSQIPLAMANPSNNFAVATTLMNQSADADPVGWVDQAPFLGTSERHYDLQVSSAGLRNNQGMAITIATESPSFNSMGMAWQPADRLTVQLFYRILMQKRRGA